MREALVELASSRPAMARAALPKAPKPSVGTVLSYSAPRRPRVAPAAPLKVTLRPRVREAAVAIAIAR